MWGSPGALGILKSIEADKRRRKNNRVPPGPAPASAASRRSGLNSRYGAFAVGMQLQLRDASPPPPAREERGAGSSRNSTTTTSSSSSSGGGGGSCSVCEHCSDCGSSCSSRSSTPSSSIGSARGDGDNHVRGLPGGTAGGSQGGAGPISGGVGGGNMISCTCCCGATASSGCSTADGASERQRQHRASCTASHRPPPRRGAAPAPAAAARAAVPGDDRSARGASLIGSCLQGVAALCQLFLSSLGVNRPPRASLADVPEACVAAVLSFMTPRDVGRLTCVNRTWAAAAASSLVWEGKLPESYRRLCQLSHPGRACQARRCVERLCKKGVFVESSRRQQMLAMNAATGAIRVCFSVEQASERRWLGPPHEPTVIQMAKRVPGALFERAVHFQPLSSLLSVLYNYWFLLGSRVRCELPPGRYSVCWRLARDREQPQAGGPAAAAAAAACSSNPFKGVFKWSQEPAECYVALRGSLAVMFAVDVSDAATAQVPRWSEVKAADVVVEPWEEEDSGGGEGGERHRSPHELCPLDLIANLRLTTVHWRSGLYVDSIVLQHHKP